MLSKSKPLFEPYRVSVEFKDEMDISEIQDQIISLSSCHIVMWYVGCYGLRKAGVEYYRDHLISSIFHENQASQFWLVDLTAWNAFKKGSATFLDRTSDSCEFIERLSERIRCMKSADIFKKMRDISDKDVIQYFKQALSRVFIGHSSLLFPSLGRTVGEIFSDNCPIMENWFSLDIARAYSIFQYLEGCLLVEEIFFAQDRDPSQCCEIVFLLPNDELKYYKDSSGSFQKDVEYLISQKCKSLKIERFDIRIKFFSFKYGNRLTDRPYNAPGKVLKNRDLSIDYFISPKANQIERYEYAVLHK